MFKNYNEIENRKQNSHKSIKPKKLTTEIFDELNTI